MTKLLIGLDEAADQSNASDFLLAKEAADTLNTAYPGHLWAISVDGGMLSIRNLMLSADWGYRLKVPLIYSASAFLADVKRAGGEILERFQMARGRFDEARYAGLVTNFAGDPVFDK